MRKTVLHTRIVLFVLLFLLFFNIPSGYCLFDKFFAKRQIVKWNESNVKNVDFYIEAINIFRQKQSYSASYDHFFCFHNGIIKNNTKDIMQKVIVTIQFLSNEKEVLKKNICLNINIFPTANIKLDQCFKIESIYFYRSDQNKPDSADELYKLKQQLGETFGWRLGKIIFIPKSESLDEYPQHSLGIDINYEFDYDADKQIAE